MTLELLDSEQYSSYKEGVFALRSKSVYETMKRNKLLLYKNTNTVVIKIVSYIPTCMLHVTIVKEI